MIEDVVRREALPVSSPVGPAGTPHTQQAGPADPTSQPVKQETLENTVARVQQSVEQFNSSLKIEIDHDSKQVIVKVLNDESGEIIRQIPAEEMVEIARRLDASQALLFTKRT